MAVLSVSILTSFFNASQFLEDAVASVLAQTYDDWELLLIDDGSTDGSTDIARQWATRMPQRVRYLEHPGHANRGISASQNLGLQQSSGKYVAFLDSDDIWLPHKLTEQVSTLDAWPEVAMLFGNTFYWYGWTGDVEDVQKDRLIPAGLPYGIPIGPPEFLVRLVRQQIPVPCPSDVLIRRDRALHVGGFEERFVRIFTDQAFYSKLSLEYPVLAADAYWFKYRKHPRSAVAAVSARGELAAARAAFLDWLGGYLATRDAAPQLQRAVQGARFKAAYPALWRFGTRRVLPVATALVRNARRLLDNAPTRRP